MSKEPLISIIINSYNGEKFITKSLDSALNQTYNNFEIIFWDNNSTDNTEFILKKYLSFSKIKYYKSNSHELLYSARKKAIEVAKGDYFAFLDVDDWWDKDKLKKQINLFNKKEVGIVCSNYWLINERKRKPPKKVFTSIPQGLVINDLLKKNFVGMSTLVISRKAYESLEYGFDDSYEIIGDYDLVLRLSERWHLSAIQEPCSYYRWHGDNLSIKKMKLNNDELILWIKKMKNNKSFKNIKNFQYLISLTLFYKSLILILSNKRLKALFLINKIKDIKLKLKLIILLLTPSFFIKILRS